MTRFIQLQPEQMHTMDGRHIIWLACQTDESLQPQWDDNGFDTVNGYPVMVDFTRGGVWVSDCK